MKKPTDYLFIVPYIPFLFLPLGWSLIRYYNINMFIAHNLSIAANANANESVIIAAQNYSILPLPLYSIHVCAGGVCKEVKSLEVDENSSCAYGYNSSAGAANDSYRDNPDIVVCNSFMVEITKQ